MRHRVPSHFNWTPRLVSNPSHTFCRLIYLTVKIISLTSLNQMLGGDSSVGLAASYLPDSFWIKCCWWRDSRNPLWDLPSLLYNRNRVSFLRINRPEHVCDHAPAYRACRSVFSIHFSLPSFPPLFLVILFFSTCL